KILPNIANRNQKLHFPAEIILIIGIMCTAPGNCCFNFYTRPLPANRVSNVIKTHSSCLRPAFIVQTVRGRQICYSQTFQWALDQYQKINTPEGSGGH
uniref:Chemokine interleukin-8-like domain-containing protein n=1 Tax=Amphiprion ocellaris TaxID=80972 RepID=A0AAQ5XZ11_AMPOC